ncbi:MAG: hypothetical protein EOQ42_10330 [Mesorhizobium sp.]|uniref:hypothetical protein n=1 Tax=unclassified Mesorhizobium TaxID=325217 RepID=UPI000F74E503|nr:MULTISPECIES: hypothetical protein [unclassified Mesorhizobium]AZN98052.1 hypothetical protein EJ066_12805 [Mesorhizobium sp. M9A.F.Ca.ET.002.03.1.2]RWB76262.1 MAG: hypothetical protein EOQ42_10330 [Mesorhizobium sp.]RWJ43605.1 MAG: hypothetical protein EOR29_17315 [Mesorhizobium sp.]RWJ78908.1 MAG: hypothetical protein EOR36_31505 [Mesorhizobium sp.]TGQ36919.1 hypothetical protein EN859_021205 [Mesorhizobium sp. M00.F.Ca.ET.216.01.1.1]
MAGEEAAPCRHRGAPPEEVVNRVAEIVSGIADDPQYLYQRGLSAGEFRLALPAAIEKLRGSTAASNADRRDFLGMIFDHMLAVGAIASVVRPVYGKDTVYQLAVPDIGNVAIIQKGCPDGAHSSVAWSVPSWAVETYLWWLCPSLASEPGEHVFKGVNRLRRRFFSDAPDTLDGIIFHNDLCGSDLRPCPKMGRAVEIGGNRIPPPCIWIMPERGQGPDFNWHGRRQRRFPAVLLSSFNVDAGNASVLTGYIGFHQGVRGIRTTVASRFGPGRLTTFRS